MSEQLSHKADLFRMGKGIAGAGALAIAGLSMMHGQCQNSDSTPKVPVFDDPGTIAADWEYGYVYSYQIEQMVTTESTVLRGFIKKDPAADVVGRITHDCSLKVVSAAGPIYSPESQFTVEAPDGGLFGVWKLTPAMVARPDGGRERVEAYVEADKLRPQDPAESVAPCGLAQ